MVRFNDDDLESILLELEQTHKVVYIDGHVCRPDHNRDTYEFNIIYSVPKARKIRIDDPTNPAAVEIYGRESDGSWSQLLGSPQALAQVYQTTPTPLYAS